MNNNSYRTGHDPHRNQSKEEFWRRAMKQFAASGQSVRAFCQARGLTEPRFYAWRTKIQRRDAAASAASAQPAFVPVRLEDQQSGCMEILLDGGRCIRLHGPVDRAALAEVVAALESIR